VQKGDLIAGRSFLLDITSSWFCVSSLLYRPCSVNSMMRVVLHLFATAAIAHAFQPVARPTPAAFSTRLRMADGSYDFDVAIIGCGVGGHGAALHSRAQNLKTAVFSGEDVGGTCVNRGCVPSKALLAASGRVRDMKNDEHLKSLGIEVKGEVSFSREGIAAHAKNLANRVKGNLEASLVGLGVDVIEGRGVLTGKPHEIKDEKTGKVYTAKVRNARRARQSMTHLDTQSPRPAHFSFRPRVFVN
jgi:Pyridine nucleotide-disulphide oxidoreductase